MPAPGSAAEPPYNTAGPPVVDFPGVTAVRGTLRSYGPWCAIAIASTFLIVHAWRYLPIFDDDAFISLRYADRLVSGHGLTWTDGPRVEGYSNLLWILLIAAIGSFGVDLVIAARVLGAALTIGAIAAVAYSGPRDFKNAALPLSLGVLVIPLSIPIAVWSIAGLEQPLVACLLAWTLTIVRGASDAAFPRRAWTLASILLGLLCLARPDSPVLVIAILLGVEIASRPRKRSMIRVMTLAAGPLLAICGQQIFRVAYYGRWISNPALVKVAFSGRRLEMGTDYIVGGYASMWPIVALALFALVYSLSTPQLRQRQYPIIFIAGLWSLYLMLVGGDIFAAWRQLVPLIIAMTFVITDAACRFQSSDIAVGTRTALSLLFLAAPSAGLWTQSRDYTNQRALSQHSEWQGRTVGLMLKRAFGEAAPLIAVDAAGSTPYWSQLPALDMLGLNDPYLPRHRPPDFGRGLIGHELGDGAYVLERKPDLVLFRSPAGQKDAVYLSGRQMQASKEFARDYSLVTFESRPPDRIRSQIWVRRTSPKIGIRPDRDILIPAFLLLGQSSNVARETESGSFAVSVDASTQLRAERIAAPPGRWRLTTEPEISINGAITIGDQLIAEGVAPFEFTIPGDGESEINIALQPAVTAELVMLKLVKPRP